MSTHYGLDQATLRIGDGERYSLANVQVSLAFGGDLSHRWLLHFSRRQNETALAAIKQGEVIEVDGHAGTVDIVQLHPMQLARDTDHLVVVGIM